MHMDSDYYSSEYEEEFSSEESLDTFFDNFDLIIEGCKEICYSFNCDLFDTITSLDLHLFLKKFEYLIPSNDYFSDVEIDEITKKEREKENDVKIDIEKIIDALR